MSLNWESRRDPYYQRFRRNVTRQPSAEMAFLKDLTTVQSLIEALSKRSEPYFYRKRFDRDDDNFDCDEVFPNIYIGDGRTAKEKEYLKKLGITHVLNTAEGKAFSMVDTDSYFYESVGIKYLGFQLFDHPAANISMHFHEAADFIHNAISTGGKVYVHCLMGISRSSTCVIAYLMLKKGMTAAEAIRAIKHKREIHPNEGFLQQLADLDNTLKRQRKLWGLRHPY